MNSRTIMLPVEDEIALLYEQASPETQRKVQTLVSVLLRETTLPETLSLSELMDIISDRAQARGLTPEILGELLNDE